MKDSIYMCYNTLTHRYERTFGAESNENASFAFAQSKPAIPTYKYLELCKVAEVDIETGVVTPLSAPVRISKFIEEENEPTINSIEKKAVEN